MRRQKTPRAMGSLMSLRPTPKHFWIFPILVVGLSTILTLPMSQSVAAQATVPAATEPPKPGAAGKVKTKSKETWADMKVRWAKQKDRWAECQKQEKAEKRSRTASRAFLDDCMTGQ
jgi:hypothetical protein